MQKVQVKVDELVENCQEGKKGSEKELYDHFFFYAMSVSLRYSSSYEEAIEVVNDSFLKIFKAISKFENTNFKAWLRRIVINTAANHYQKNKKHNFVESLSNQSYDISAGELITAQLSYDDLLQLIQKLTPAYRTVFDLYVIDGYKHSEIAKMLGISIGASKSNLARARGILKDLIKKTSNHANTAAAG